MKRHKLLLIFVALIIVAAVTGLVLQASPARAQGLVEYQLCPSYAQDITPDIIAAGVDPQTGENSAADYFEAIFGIPWQADYGFIGYCAPQFSGKPRAYTGIRMVLIAYQDLDDPFDGLTSGDLEVKVVRQNFKF